MKNSSLTNDSVVLLVSARRSAFCTKSTNKAKYACLVNDDVSLLARMKN